MNRVEQNSSLCPPQREDPLRERLGNDYGNSGRRFLLPTYVLTAFLKSYASPSPRPPNYIGRIRSKSNKEGGGQVRDPKEIHQDYHPQKQNPEGFPSGSMENSSFQPLAQINAYSTLKRRLSKTKSTTFIIPIAATALFSLIFIVDFVLLSRRFKVE